MSEDDKKELHAKLDALIDADFLVLAALINQLHYETFFRKNLAEGLLEERLKAHIDREFDRAIRAPTGEEFEEITFGESAQLEVMEALVWAVLNEQLGADRVFCNLIRKTFRHYAEDRI
jgi:hypothetical protein